jgi:hypothetical protein
MLNKTVVDGSWLSDRLLGYACDQGYIAGSFQFGCLFIQCLSLALKDAITSDIIRVSNALSTLPPKEMLSHH